MADELNSITVRVKVEVDIPLWQAIKLRIAGADAARQIVEELVRKVNA